jgi:hypothetical protein
LTGLATVTTLKEMVEETAVLAYNMEFVAEAELF